MHVCMYLHMAHMFLEGLFELFGIATPPPHPHPRRFHSNWPTTVCAGHVRNIRSCGCNDLSARGAKQRFVYTHHRGSTKPVPAVWPNNGNLHKMITSEYRDRQPHYLASVLVCEWLNLSFEWTKHSKTFLVIISRDIPFRTIPFKCRIPVYESQQLH